ncbi:MAG: hypothetical protein ACXW4Q_00775 [Anaerolineales bacterium]
MDGSVSNACNRFLPEAMKALERCQEIQLSKDTKELLSRAPPVICLANPAGVKISSASIDRRLRPIRIKSQHSLSTTKPDSSTHLYSMG